MICDTIKKHGKYSPKCSDSGVLLSTIYVCLNIKEDSIPIPIFRIPNYDPKVRVYVLLCLEFKYNFSCYTRKFKNVM
jgi:hypothetical protein